MRREVAEDVGHFVGGLIADFHAVRARHVGQRRAPHVVRLVVVIQPGVAVVHHVGHGHAAGQAALLHRDERRVVERTGRRRGAPVAEELREGRFEQQLAGHRRRVPELHDVLGAIGFWLASGDHVPNPYTPIQSSPRTRHASASLAYELPLQLELVVVVAR